MTKRATVLLALVATAMPLGLQAQDTTKWRMQQVASVAGNRGFEMTSQYYHGSLNSGRIQEWNLELSDRRQQMIVAVCDSDCTDLDISLFEADGQEIAADRSRDNHPVIFVPSGHPGAHRIRVSMPACSLNPCRYELAVFAR